MQLLKKLFGARPAQPAGDPNAIYCYVKGAKCGAITRVRISKGNDLSREEGDTGFFVRKTVVDSKCFGQVELELGFDLNYRETRRTISGGEFVSREEWERYSAEHAKPG